jgi:DNA end-binding protein Ku
MVRSIWSGSLSFGLVNIPVKVVNAVKERDIHFHQLHAKDHSRIKYKKWCPKDGVEVPNEDIVRGYEVARDQYVIVTDEELDNVDPEASRTIDIIDFVPLDTVDPAYFERPYYLVPDKNAGKAYALLLESIKKAKRVGIARVVMRGKEYLVAIRVRGDVLTMETMRYAEEVVPPSAVAEDLQVPEKELNKREVQMAEKLIEALSTDFNPDKYEDTYRKRVMKLIDEKAEGKEVVLQPQLGEPKKTGDLVAALEKSIAEARKRIHSVA